MKFIPLIASLAFLVGCSTQSEWNLIQNPYTHGYKTYDPCIRCGEGWSFIPNERFAAQKSADR
jgi:hypothetical protein